MMQRDRHTYGQTDRQKDRKTERLTDRQTDRQAGTHRRTPTRTDIHTDTQIKVLARESLINGNIAYCRRFVKKQSCNGRF